MEWILLDTHSTMSVFNNKLKMFTKIQVSNAKLAQGLIIKFDDPVRMHLKIYCEPTKYTTVQSLLMILADLLPFMDLIFSSLKEPKLLGHL